MFCPGKKLSVGIVVYISLLPFACVCRCDGDVMCVGHDMNRCSLKIIIIMSLIHHCIFIHTVFRSIMMVIQGA